MGFTIRGNRIVEIDVQRDPERLKRLDLTVGKGVICRATSLRGIAERSKSEAKLNVHSSKSGENKFSNLFSCSKS
jgi:hypothetical protein